MSILKGAALRISSKVCKKKPCDLSDRSYDLTIQAASRIHWENAINGSKIDTFVKFCEKKYPSCVIDLLTKLLKEIL